VCEYKNGDKDALGAAFKLWMKAGGGWLDRVQLFRREVERRADTFHVRSYVHQNGVLSVRLTAYKHGKRIW
jgi:hypothetical protein